MLSTMEAGLPAAGETPTPLVNLTEAVEMLHFFMQRFITFKFATPIVFALSDILYAAGWEPGGNTIGDGKIFYLPQRTFSEDTNPGGGNAALFYATIYNFLICYPITFPKCMLRLQTAWIICHK